MSDAKKLNVTEMAEIIVENYEGKFAKKDVVNMMKEFVSIIVENLKNGEDIYLAGFGTFKIVEKAARVRFNPKTKEQFESPAYKAIKFTTSANLKRELKKA